MPAPPSPLSATWDLTYACQLRCGYCYSESGRRAARTLPHADLLRIADTLAGMGLRSVQLSGGEPLLVRGLSEIVERLRARGTKVVLFTNGLLIDDGNASELGRLFALIRVGVDGATAEVHDRVRGREGAFLGALDGLAALDRAAASRRSTGQKRIRFGIETVVVRSNFPDIERICTEIVPRFPELSLVCFGAAVPAGPANAERYAASELLSDEQVGALRDPAFAARLRALLPPSIVELGIGDNFDLAMTTDRLDRGGLSEAFLQIEVDGGVRGMAIYEGTVGNILHDPPDVLWQRVLERRHHPLARKALASIRGLSDWASAARQLDWHFGSDESRARIRLRTEGEQPG
jgi:MoaA/NifB/PqqE/SkfB family radical SAM enzyme